MNTTPRTLAIVRLLPLVVAAILAAPATAQNVNDLWANKCASCHGANGEGASAESLVDAADWLGVNDRILYDKVRAHGTGGDNPPAFTDGTTGTDLDPADAWAMVNFTRELQNNARKQREPAPTPGAGGVFTSDHASFKLETVLDHDINTPWSVSWLADARMLITERGGNLRVLEGTTLSAPIRNTPPVFAQGQGGMLDVAVLNESGQSDPWVYLTFADPKGRLSTTRVVRGHVHNAGRGQYVWADQQDIFHAKDKDYLSGGIQFGSRIVFDSDGHLFFSVGDRLRADHAQDLSVPEGKIHRLNLDGTVPNDNPFVSNADALPSIWSYGHRNTQGLALDANGTLWETEHGPRGGDEVNVIKPGQNYGWPLVSYGMNYNGTSFQAPWADQVNLDTDKTPITMPVYRWLPSIAPCGLDVGVGDQFPKWNGDLFAGGLAGQVLERLRFQGEVLTEREELLRGIGRVRDVVFGPDGNLYLVLNQPDKIVRLVPDD